MRRKGAIAVVLVGCVGIAAFVGAAVFRDDSPIVSEPPSTIDPITVFCTTVTELAIADPFGAVEAAASAAAAEAAFDAGLAKIRPLVQQAPADIKPAAVAYVAGFEAYGALLAAAGYNGSQVDHDQLAAVSSEVARAQAELETYALATCR